MIFTKPWRGTEKIKQSTDWRYQLKLILQEAYLELTEGKASRHGADKSFHQQDVSICRDNYGSGFTCGQATKKILEAENLSTINAKIKEYRGAIGYLALEILYLKREEKK